MKGKSAKVIEPVTSNEGLDRSYQKYKCHLEYPRKEDYTTVYGYKEGKVVFTKSPRDITKDDTLLVTEAVLDSDAFKAAKSVYNKEVGRLHDLFRYDLSNEYDVVGHPKFDQCFAIAWEYGHSYGFSEVALHFETLVDLIK